MNREGRILDAVERWRQCNGRGCLQFPSRLGNLIILKVVELFLSKNPTAEVIIGTPSKASQYQWYSLLLDKGLYGKCKVYTFEYIIKYIKKTPLLILDEVQKSLSSSYKEIYTLPFKYFLGMSPLVERSDNKHISLLRMYPLLDSCSKEEAIANKWLDDYKEYKVVIDVDDFSVYKESDAKFNNYLRFFNYDFNLALECVKKKETRYSLASFKSCKIDLVNACTFGFNRELKKKIQFVQSHPKKIALAKRILDSRTSSKAIIFSPTIEISKEFEGIYYNSSMKSRERAHNLSRFQGSYYGTLSAVESIPAGIDLKGCNLAIMLCNNSSFTTKEKKLERILCNNKEKLSEAFTFVIKNSIDEEWFRRSTRDNDYITITEKMLDKVLRGEDILEERIEGPVMLNNY